MPCEGQLIAIGQNQALYSLIGKVYGGDGIKTFSLPDLRGRVAIDQGYSTVQSAVYQLGNKGGAETISLSNAQVPDHAHTVNAYNGAGNAALAQGLTFAAKASVTALANEDISAYVSSPSPTSIVTLHPGTVSPTGGAAHDNRMPYTSLQVCIATVGLYPQRP
jgi:microcystin-dependent protein